MDVPEKGKQKIVVSSLAYLERWSETFCVRKTPTTESTTDPFQGENRLSPGSPKNRRYGQ